MSKELELKLKKLLDSPEAHKKLAAEMTAPLKKSLHYDGSIKTLLTPCAICGMVRYQHYPGDHHPWCKDNLAYLVWKYEQRISKR